MGQSAATKPGTKGGSVFDQSAAGLENAGRATLFAGQGYGGIANDPTGGLGKPVGYNAATMTGTGYGAATQANPAAIRSGIAGYMNPWTESVVKRAQGDVNRQTQLGLRDIGDTAAGAGAFGGSRQGIAEGTAVGEGSRALGDITAQLRAAGFDKAAGLAGQDITNRMTAAGANQAAINRAREYSAGATQTAAGANQDAINRAREYSAGASSTAAQQAAANRMAALGGVQSAGAQGAALAGQGVGIGQGLAGNEAQGGSQIQQIIQSLLGQSAGMFDQYTGQPLQSTSAILQLLAGNPLSSTGTQTQTNTPGLKTQLGDVLKLANKTPIPGM